MLITWQILASIVDNPIKFPTPIATYFAFVEIVGGQYFIKEIFYTLKRTSIGFIISFMMGVSLGTVAGFCNPIYYFMHPIVSIQRSMPTMGVILLALIWLNREIAPILVGILIAFPIIYSAVVNAVRNIDKQLLEMTQIYQFTKRKKLCHLYYPSVKSSLMAVTSTAIGLNIKVGIAAEVLSQPRFAIGTGLQMEKVALNTAGVLAWSVIAIILSATCEWLISQLFRLSVPKNTD
ncbi:ABC-type nitrate/sulfonate/bicarbonate transport system permease component [Fusibacter sp. 3D3]|nr:ABC-type nitrate/sulfonate/bicarbonate transport system permease component [Fusibacter sp. 3D3]